MGPISFSDLLAQETKREPAAFFARLRAQGPLLRLTTPISASDAWLATTYDDVIAILKDPRFSKDPQKFAPTGRGQAGASHTSLLHRFITARRDMLTVDPPDHTRLRGLVSKAFTPRMIERLRPRIQQITDGLLDAVQGREEIDLIADFALPLPITVISDMLGVPVEDRAQFHIWSQLIITGTASAHPEEALAALEACVEYIKALLAQKRSFPSEDVVSGLVHAQEDGDRLQEQELISTIFLLIVAGHETTVNLIGNGTLALLTHPEQKRQLSADPSLISSAVEELLRYTSPVSLSSLRWASEDIALHGEVIHRGELVFVALMGANMDPQHVPDPEALDITRRENQHLAFGKGIHYCLGAPLARLEGQIAISTLLQRLPHLKLACEPEQLIWNSSPILRGLTSLPVTF